MAGTHCKLKGAYHYSQELLTNQVEKNLIDFFNYSLLEIGAFQTIRVPQSGLYGGSKSRLRLVDDPNYTKGQVWEGYRNDWVWESGLDYRTQPIRVSGIVVNGTFHPTSGIGTYAHVVDYPNGRIIFHSAISTTATVQCSFSHRAVSFTNTDAPWFREVQKRSYRTDDSTYNQFGSGAWNQLSQTRVVLPAVAVDTVFIPPSPGLELGGGQRKQHMLGFYIIAENPSDRNKIADLISYQKEKDLWLYNINGVSPIRQPVDVSGSPTPSGYTYPNMVAESGDGGYRWRYCRIANTQVNRIETHSPTLYSAEVLVTLEIAMHDI